MSITIGTRRASISLPRISRLGTEGAGETYICRKNRRVTSAAATRPSSARSPTREGRRKTYQKDRTKTSTVSAHRRDLAELTGGEAIKKIGRDSGEGDPKGQRARRNPIGQPVPQPFESGDQVERVFEQERGDNRRGERRRDSLRPGHVDTGSAEENPSDEDGQKVTAGPVLADRHQASSID